MSLFLDNLNEPGDDQELPSPVRNIADGGIISDTSASSLSVGGGGILSVNQVGNGALSGSEFAYTTPCLVKGMMNSFLEVHVFLGAELLYDSLFPSN